ncbi:MAG: stage II sporulation protein D [Clostridia bacterium]|nr:stage II sporulation protein D [Clostridia bacterium]
MNRRKKKQKQNPVIVITLAAVLLALCVLLFLLMRLVLSGREIKAESCQPIEEPGSIAIQTPAPTILDLYAYFNWTETTTIKVYDHRADKLVDMDLEEYIVGVVSAEMPAYYDFEALKAQAVASRTYTLYSMAHGGCHTNPDADVCTNSKCCQAFSTHERMQNAWKDDYANNYNRVAQAVMETAGEVLVCDGKLCDALYHACSGGQTENSENVYANALPYLRGVDSPYEDPMREEDVDFGTDALVELIAAKYPESGITKDNVREGIAIEKAYESGRVETLRLGKTKITGKQARNLFGLRSTMFTVEWTEKGIVFHVKGYGHGVGMSQNGANGMAKHGADYREILFHYYTGVSIASYGADGITEQATPAPESTGNPFVPEG